jgi:hypothetical protein
MSRSRARLAADWFAKLRQNAVTQEVEHTDVVDAETEALEAKADAAAVGIIVGPIGPIGPQGPQGATGATGTVSYNLGQNDLTNGNTIYMDNWYRSTGSTGWYNQSYGGGINMQDTTWVRVYGNKRFYVASTSTSAINTPGGIQCATIRGGVPSTSASAAGSVGSYALMGVNTAYDNVQRTPGSTLSGSALLYANANRSGSTKAGGSWRLMGHISMASTSSTVNISIWLRYA